MMRCIAIHVWVLKLDTETNCTYRVLSNTHFALPPLVTQSLQSLMVRTPEVPQQNRQDQLVPTAASQTKGAGPV